MNPAVASLDESPAPRAPARGRRIFWLALLAAVLAFALGWFASAAWTATSGLRITGGLAGTVSLVNATGEAICLEPDGGGAQRCAVAYDRRDDPLLAVGDHVSVAVGWLRTSRGTEEEVFMIVARG